MRVSQLFACLLTVAVITLPQGAIAQTILDQLVQQGNAAQEAGHFAEAETLWREVLALTPDDADVYYSLGLALDHQGKFDEAIAAFRRAIQLKPDSVNAHYGLAAALDHQGKPDEAVAAFRQVTQLTPNYADAYFGLGVALYEQGELDQAIAAYQRAIQLRPDYADAYNNLGNVLGRQGKLDEAIAAYRQAIQFKPGSASAPVYCNLGNVLDHQGKPDEAIAAYRQAIDLQPDAENAYYGLGVALYHQGRLDEAIAAFRQATQLKPDAANAYYGLGVALYDQGRLDEAIAAYRQVIQLKPDYADAYCNLGVTLERQGQLDAAIAAYHQSLSLPEHTTGALTSAHTLAHNGLGLILYRQGKLDAAIAEYRQAIQLDPTYAIAQNNLNEAQRTLALQNHPQPIGIDDRHDLPSEKDEPLVRVLRSTARVIAQGPEGSTIGAGWVIKREGNTVWIVTNRHVVSDRRTKQTSSDIKVEFFSNLRPEQRPRYTATVVQITPAGAEPDLAVLKVTGIPDDIQPLHPGQVSRNTHVWVIGHPYTINNPWNSSAGEIGDYNPDHPIVPVKAYVADGDSGGPVITDQMQVIGMIVQVRSSRDSAIDPDHLTAVNIQDAALATGDVGLAYQIDVVIKQLQAWRILN